MAIVQGTTWRSQPDCLPAIPEERFVVHGISWQAYLAISDALADRSAPRLTYVRGNLEFMTPLSSHEMYKKRLGRLIETLAEECGLRIETAGSMTFRREDLEHGFELDDCFWIEHEAAVRGKLAYDPQRDPPPDIGLEIEISRSALNRMALFAAVRVAQVWRFNGQSLWVEVLQPDGTYLRADRSPTFPWAPLDEIVPFVEPNPMQDYLSVISAFRQWVREKSGTKRDDR